MMKLVVFPAILVLVVMVVVVHIKRLVRDQSQYSPVVGTVIDFVVHFNRLYDYLTEKAKKRQTFRIILTHNHSFCYTVDPRNVERFLKTRFDNYVVSGFHQCLLRDLFGEGIFAVNGDKWRHQRKLASFEFSTRVLRDFASRVFRRNAVKMVRSVSGISETERRRSHFNIVDLLMRFTLDSIFEIGFGMELNCLNLDHGSTSSSSSKKEGIEFMKAFDEANALIYLRYVDPFWKIKKALGVGSEAALKRHIRVIHDFANQVITRKRNLLQHPDIRLEKEDILSRFLEVSKDDPEEMNDEYLRDIILNFIIAGKDTTSNTLAWFIYLLCKHPIIQEKIVQEVEQAMVLMVGAEEEGGDRSCESKSKTIDGYVECITDEALEKMHYLHAALTETLRLYPAVPIDGRSAVEDDVLPDGYKVKRGDDLCYLSYSMGRMSCIWGDDAEEFRPERWLENGVFKPQSPFKFISFHGGPRMCLGKEFAYRQMKIVSMALIYFFRFKLADETTRVNYRTMLTLHIDGGLHVSASPRRIVLL